MHLSRVDLGHGGLEASKCMWLERIDFELCGFEAYLRGVGRIWAELADLSGFGRPWADVVGLNRCSPDSCVFVRIWAFWAYVRGFDGSS